MKPPVAVRPSPLDPAAQLRDLIGTLERRVVERTNALQHRALQLETSGRVSREITSILDIDRLIDAAEFICGVLGRPTSSRAGRALALKRAPR